MILIKQLYRFLVFSNLLIAMAAMAQCLLTYVILGMPINFNIVSIEGAATLLLYNVSLRLSKPQNPQQSPYLRTRWVFKHEKLLWFNSTLALILLSYALLDVDPYTWLFLGFVGMISMAYSVPIFRINGKRGGMRQIPGLKVFHIALVWSLSGVGLPVVELWASGYAIDWYVANYLGIVKILFLVICTLPFDIRDMAQDSYYHLKTIPTLLGETKAKRLCYLLLLLQSLFVIVAPYAVVIKVGLLGCNSIVFFLLRLVLNNAKHYHYAYLLDVSLILQFLTVYVMYLVA
ncbi:hypothetical protein ACL9RF_15580 [Sphingobacterium sp. Mn56C]|uniref:hypothetical protein n=1 Tax=Sphingobacterium sp. Mn56C TaxID=3395261 RepID=UPI003BE1F6AB